MTTRLFQAWAILPMQAFCCAVCLHAVWVAKPGKVWVKSTAGRTHHMPCHLNPNYLNIRKVKTSIRALFLLLFLNQDIILSSSLTLIAADINISLRTPFWSKTWYRFGPIRCKACPRNTHFSPVLREEIWTRQMMNVTQLFRPKMGRKQFFIVPWWLLDTKNRHQAWKK